MGTTSNYNWPYPEATGLVKDGWEDIKDLATSIDTTAAASFGGSLKKINTTSFSAVSSIALPNGTFSSTYQNYRIIYVFSASTSQSHTIRLRTGGTDASGSNYNTKGLFSGSTGSVGNINNAGTTNWYSFTTSNGVIIVLELYRPFEASTTLGFGTHYGDGSGDQRLSHLDHGLATSYDSINLICSTGTMTGVVRAYGYQN